MSKRRAGRWLALAPALALFAGVALAPMIELAVMSVSRIEWREAQANWSFAGAATLRPPRARRAVSRRRRQHAGVRA